MCNHINLCWYYVLYNCLLFILFTAHGTKQKGAVIKNEDEVVGQT